MATRMAGDIERDTRFTHPDDRDARVVTGKRWVGGGVEIASVPASERHARPRREVFAADDLFEITQ